MTKNRYLGSQFDLLRYDCLWPCRWTTVELDYRAEGLLRRDAVYTNVYIMIISNKGFTSHNVPRTKQTTFCLPEMDVATTFVRLSRLHNIVP